MNTYNHAKYLDGRCEMLQRYADYMDNLGPTGMLGVGSLGVVLG